MLNVSADEGGQVQVVIEDLTWTATARPEGWSLAVPSSGTPAAVVRMDPGTAWRLCTRMIEPATAISRSDLQGDQRLCTALCQIVSIIR